MIGLAPDLANDNARRGVRILRLDFLSRLSGVQKMYLPSSQFSNVTKRDLLGIGYGYSSVVARIADTSFVVKIAHPDHKDDIETERIIYERLQNHPNVLKYHGQIDLEHAIFPGALLFDYHSSGDLAQCLSLNPQHPHRTRWPFQATSAINFVHSKDIVLADIGLHNFLLSAEGNLILCDFAGSSIDGRVPTVSPGARYTHPLYDYNHPSKRFDLFALGTVLYELSVGERLFKDQDDVEIEDHFRQGQFPDLSNIESSYLRTVIKNCWQKQDYTAPAAKRELEGGALEGTSDCSTVRQSGYYLRWYVVAAAVLVLAHRHFGKRKL